MKPVAAVLVGAGQRGRHVYGAWAEANPQRLRFVAVAEPDPGRREAFAGRHHIPPSRRYADAAELIAAGRLTEAAIIASNDRHHLEPALAALSLGYQVLLEKPMAATFEDCLRLAGDPGRARLHIAHVLRFTPFFQTVHEVISSGRLGDVVTVEHRENVVAWHMAHSFVRGNWAQAGLSTPMIVQKCCHDFDILSWNLPSPVRRLSSFGSLMHFRPEQAPPQALPRCTDGCPVDCPFDARRIYLNPKWTGWPVHVITDDLSMEARRAALRDGPYGRCVYTAGSDVVDHQAVLMEHEDGSTTNLIMHGHSHEESRTMRYDGTRATLRGIFGRRQVIEVSDHRDGATTAVPIPTVGGGHGGGDDGLIEAFLSRVTDGSPGLTNVQVALESHLLAFTAEESRLSGLPVELGARRVTVSPS
jgi:predicted dehydrogenase